MCGHGIRESNRKQTSLTKSFVVHGEILGIIQNVVANTACDVTGAVLAWQTLILAYLVTS